MTFAVHVAGGTGAGLKRPMRWKPKAWHCDCVILCDGSCGETDYDGICDFRERPGYLVRCPDCKMARP